MRWSYHDLLVRLQIDPLSGHLLELQEQFDIDHVQEEAETAIQEKAFELGKKAEKVTGITGRSLGEATDQEDL